MKKKILPIQWIGLALALVYATSFLIYLERYYLELFQKHALVLMFLFGFSFIGAVAVTLRRDFGRAIVLITNILLIVYLMRLYFIFGDIIPLSYIAMGAVIILFFAQTRVPKTFIPKHGQWKCVLVIDDDETQLHMVRGVLVPHGYSVLTASSGEEGLTIVKQQKPDIVLLDVILPRLKGREICRRIKEDATTKDIPVVFLTSKDSPDDIKAELEVGAVAHLTKPIDAKTLLSVIEDIFEK